MAPIEFTARRSIFALGFAIAIIASPVVAAIAGSAPAEAPRILAQCTTTTEPGNAELDCEPPAINEFGGGAPSEMQLTDSEGVGDPGSPVHGR